MNNGRNLYSLLIIFLSSLFFGYDQKPFAVIELFTSEGCSSCPSAEKVLQEIKAEAERSEQNIFCLEYHVDYWNHLGWKDQYSSFQFTKRQENYTSAVSEKNIYTPMVIVNGEHPVTGSNAEEIKSNIRAALSKKPGIQLTAGIDSIVNDTAYVSYKASKIDKNYFLRLAVTEDDIISKIGQGENSGKNLKHEAVVRIFTTIELKQEADHTAIPLKKFIPNKSCQLIVFIQHKQTMQVLAATSQRF